MDLFQARQILTRYNHRVSRGTEIVILDATSADDDKLAQAVVICAIKGDAYDLSNHLYPAIQRYDIAARLGTDLLGRVLEQLAEADNSKGFACIELLFQQPEALHIPQEQIHKALLACARTQDHQAIATLTSRGCSPYWREHYEGEKILGRPILGFTVDIAAEHLPAEVAAYAEAHNLFNELDMKGTYIFDLDGTAVLFCISIASHNYPPRSVKAISETVPVADVLDHVLPRNIPRDIDCSDNHVYKYLCAGLDYLERCCPVDRPSGPANPTFDYAGVASITEPGMGIDGR